MLKARRSCVQDVASDLARSRHLNAKVILTVNRINFFELINVLVAHVHDLLDVALLLHIKFVCEVALTLIRHRHVSEYLLIKVDLLGGFMPCV